MFLTGATKIKTLSIFYVNAGIAGKDLRSWRYWKLMCTCKPSRLKLKRLFLRVLALTISDTTSCSQVGTVTRVEVTKKGRSY
jgi:hypothetical protein